MSYFPVTGSQLPQLTSLLPSTRTSFHLPKGKKQQPTPIDTVLSNPFSLSPIAFSIALVFPSFFLPQCVKGELFDCEADSLIRSHQIRSFDLFLAAIQALVTFSVAYPASVALGSVLLQTSPPRGLASGVMEDFLRVMREVRFSLSKNLPCAHRNSSIDRETPSSTPFAPTAYMATDALDAHETIPRRHPRDACSKGSRRRRCLEAEQVGLG